MDSISHGSLTDVRVFRPAGAPREVVLVLSGDGGWGRPVEDIAQRLAARGSLVAGIDARVWLAHLEEADTSCVAPGAYLADLGHFLAARFGAPDTPPLLVGHSAGATLAYVAMAQGRHGAYAGLLTLAFCTDLDLRRPLCPGGAVKVSPEAGGVRLLPGGELGGHWISLHGLEDRECPAADDRAFAAAVPGTQFVPLPGVGHSYAEPEEWWSAFTAARRALAAGDGGT
ncbi:MAG: hypothetical protein JSS29_07175 [Proteobacteria bacterium]|nr:hypothetical protein [Pseudomonadota bacterium]